MNLENAVSSIYQIVDQHRENGFASPFFFIVGAGISHPPVKLAREIEEDCRKIAVEKYKNKTSPKSTKPSDTYAHWLIAAHQTAQGVQRYLRKMMQGLPISKANLRLAHLLLDGRIAKTVFTPNFDDMLERSLQLFGASPLVCDHPLTVQRMDPNAFDIQIVHVHGSYWFYDCCNDNQEIKDRSLNEPMSQMLDYFLHNHSPIVVGYSGWEGDVLMSALQRRLKSKLGYPIYWFCYRSTAKDSLPAWLTGNEDVRFVYPDEPVEAMAYTRAASPEQAAGLSRSLDAFTDVDSARKIAALPSDKVFDALVTEFQLEPPELTRDPLKLYADQLRRFIGTSDSEADGPDTFYSFQNAISRVELAAIEDTKRPAEPLRGIREAMSQANYQQVIRLSQELEVSDLTHKDGLELIRVLEDACSSLIDGSDDKSEGYRVAALVGDSLLKRRPADLALRGLVAKALSLQGRNLLFTDRYAEALQINQDVLARFDHDEDSTMGDSVARALGNKAVCLWGLGRKEEAVATSDAVLARFEGSQDAALRLRVAVATGNKGIFLAGLGRNEEAISAFDAVLAKFGDAQEPAFREQVANALFNRGVALGQIGKNEEAIAAYDTVLAKFGDAQELALREQVANALFNRGVALGQIGKNEEAIAAYDTVLAKFGDAQEPVLHESVASAKNNLRLIQESKSGTTEEFRS